MNKIFEYEFTVGRIHYGYTKGMSPIDGEIKIDETGYFWVDVNDGGWKSINDRLNHISNYSNFNQIVTDITSKVNSKYEDKGPFLKETNFFYDDFNDLLNCKHAIKDKNNIEVDNSEEVSNPKDKKSKTKAKKMTSDYDSTKSTNNVSGFVIFIKILSATFKSIFSIFKIFFRIFGFFFKKDINNIKRKF